MAQATSTQLSDCWDKLQQLVEAHCWILDRGIKKWNEFSSDLVTKKRQFEEALINGESTREQVHAIRDVVYECHHDEMLHFIKNIETREEEIYNTILEYQQLIVDAKKAEQ